MTDASPRVRAVREVQPGRWEYVVWCAGRWWMGGTVEAPSLPDAAREAQRRALVWSTAPRVAIS